MKTFKYITTLCLSLLLLWNCTEDDNNTDYALEINPPTNLSAVVSITQDNTGVVTITPLGEGVASFNVNFGDGSEMTENFVPGNSVVNTYEEGTYEAIIIANGLNGLSTQISVTIIVSFTAPENLDVTINTDVQTIEVSATADFATSFEVFFGDVDDEVGTPLMIDETISHTYAEVGDYVVRVVAIGGGTATSEYTETITIVNPLRLPVDFENASLNYAFNDFGNTTSSVMTNPSKTGINTSDNVGVSIKPSGAEVWAGTFLQLDEPIDFSELTNIGVDVFSPKSGITVKFKVENATDDTISQEVDVVNSVANDWEHLSFDFSSIDTSKEYHKLVIFFDFGNVGDDSTYYFDNITLENEPTTDPSGLEGTWKIAPEAGSLMVGPSPGDGSWWTIDAQGVTDRACFYDDTYVFNADGSFSNILGTDTWVEGWQGGSDSCGAPIAPHDGNVAATYTYNLTTNTVTINGKGAFLGVPKANNTGELANPADAPDSIIYDVVLSDNDNTMTVIIEAGAGVFWTFKLVKEGTTTPPPPLEGTWVIAPEAGSLMVGPGPGDGSWWTIDAQGVTDRACFYDDTFVFNADGSFNNLLGADTWVEGWQGGADACGSPVAPHDGSAIATYVYDENAQTLSLNGAGAYIGVPKANNDGELPNVAVPSSITYNITLSDDNNTMTAVIEAGAGVFWTFKLVREGTSTGGGGGSTGGGSTDDYNLTLPIDFENTGFGANWTWNVFENGSNDPLEFVANPNTSGINTSSTVAKMTALQTGQPWVGTETAHGTMGITWDLSASNAIIKVMVYKTVISDVGIKLVNPSGGAQGEIKVANTKINEWEELTFDFSSRIGNGQDGSTNIDQIVIFPDFTSSRTSDNVVYFDNITFGN